MQSTFHVLLFDHTPKFVCVCVCLRLSSSSKAVRDVREPETHENGVELCFLAHVFHGCICVLPGFSRKQPGLSALEPYSQNPPKNQPKTLRLQQPKTQSPSRLKA